MDMDSLMGAMDQMRIHFDQRMSRFEDMIRASCAYTRQVAMDQDAFVGRGPFVYPDPPDFPPYSDPPPDDMIDVDDLVGQAEDEPLQGGGDDVCEVKLGMAYDAVLSLAQTLKQILDADNQHILDKKKQLIQSLLEKACNLQDFFEESWQIRDEAVRCLEQRIRDAAYTGDDIIDSLMSNPHEGFLWRIKSPLQDLISGFWLQTMEQEYQDLQEVIEEIDSLLEEVMKIKNDGVRDLPPRNSWPASSSTSAASVKNTMVGFDDDLMQLKGRLTGQ
ncbi:hypothetical protein BUALT_Bualt02G0085400 [Buddleja alternifolia]|uniref:Uncharacterized protein n=1 Tax=Buddleja alternifolia TaxID=168488 RepID=A0AAV6Y2R7_9LAMI|nr:hypothetical protein BUALT_Bualt02G0085400 [Buddleja alternifolia]